MKNLIALLSLLAFSVTAFAQDNTISSFQVVAYSGGVPSNGTNQVDTLTFGGTPSGGTFTITATQSGTLGVSTSLRSSGPIAWSSTNATLVANINNALQALNWVGSDGVTAAVGSMTSGVGTITLTFSGKLGKRSDMPVLAVTNNLTGTSPTVAIAITTPGATATYRNAPLGQILVDTTTPGLYFNSSSTKFSPTWTSK